MRFDVLHLGMILSQRIGLSIFGLAKKNTDYDECKNTLKAIEAEIYKDGGIKKYEENCANEFERLLFRSFAQYKSNIHCDVNKYLLIVKQILFFIFLIYLFFVIIFRSMSSFKKSSDEEHKEVVIFHQHQYIMNLVKDLYRSKSRVFLEVSGQRLSFDDIIFIIKCIRILPIIIIHPWFLFSLVKWISYYSHIIYQYKPKMLVNFIEGSFVSSIMTHYLRLHGILHVNHMHGEIYFSPRFAFAEFDYFHVYGKYWKILYEEMLCKAVFLIDGNDYHSYLYKFREGILNKREKNSILIIHSSLMQLGHKDYGILLKFISGLSKAWKIYFRCHPQEKLHGMKYFHQLNKDIGKYSKCHLALDRFQDEHIENCLMTYEVVIGKSSAAMLEAWIAGCKVVYIGESVELKKRYRGSKNILYINERSSNDTINCFLHTPLEKTESENKFIDYVSRIKR